MSNSFEKVLVGKAFGLADDKKEHSSKTSASDRMAALYRDQWSGWKNKFLKYDKQLIGLASGQEDNIQTESLVRDSVTRGFEVAREDGRIGRERLGLSMSNEEQNYIDKQSKKSEMTAMVTNVGKARLHADDRDKQILSGGMATGLSSNQFQGV